MTDRRPYRPPQPTETDKPAQLLHGTNPDLSTRMATQNFAELANTSRATDESFTKLKPRIGAMVVNSATGESKEVLESIPSKLFSNTTGLVFGE